jgi:acyl-CoA reductase-like NAD-dependent aldehyde dehydrogenase
MREFKMWIGGKWVSAASGQTLTTVNPATGKEIARIPLGGAEDVDRAGAVWINDHMIIGAELPWGGYKESGFGRENGILGLEEFTQVKLISINREDAKT